MLLMNNLKRAMQDELDGFFAVVHNSRGALQRVVTKAALSKARKKLKHTAFIELNEQVTGDYYRQFPDIKQWRGHRLLAVDGSKIELPNEEPIRKAFGVNKSSDRPMALLSGLYDPLNQLWVDTQFTSSLSSERDMAAAHLEFAKADDLIVYDRGYPAFWLFALHRSKGVGFCARLPWNLYNESRDLYLSAQDEEERTITLRADKAARQRCKALGISAAPLSLRLVRVALDENDDKQAKDKYEILITSLLDQQSYPCTEFGALYHLRWGVEEAYKTLKLRSELGNWSGRSIEAVRQDVHAKVLTFNLNNLAVRAAQEQVDEKARRKSRRHQYVVNRAQALSRMKDTVVRMLRDKDNGRLIDRLIDAMAQNIEPVRKGRHNPRKPRPAAGLRYKHSYKPLR